MTGSARVPRTVVRHRPVTIIALVLMAALTTVTVSTTSVSAAQATTAGARTGVQRVLPVVTTGSGAVRGASGDGVTRYLGLPYAAPPVGALRWRAPQPPASWPGVRTATRFGPDCAQNAGPFGQASTSENCLYLNVYTPAARTVPRRRPVMVWIHGGGFQGGAGRLYDPTWLVRHGVVVVTINYRLGAFGFLADRALDGARGGSGDYGLMDQQAALRWVARNIAGFGGDPHEVTLFGESSGGAAVLAQLASPATRGLFSRAIVESGAYTINTPSEAQAQTEGAALATKLGCAHQTAACLRHVPVTRILADQAGQYVPNVDPGLLPRTVRAAFASGRVQRVPLLDGTNRDEGRLTVAAMTLAGHPVTSGNYLTSIGTLLSVTSRQARRIEAAYPVARYASAAEALAAADTDDVFACPAVAVDGDAARHLPTYSYEFDDPHAPELFLPPTSFPYGAAHASELQFLFTLPDVAYPTALTAAQRQLAAIMKDDWTSFATTGRPAGAGSAAWRPFVANGSSTRVLAPGATRYVSLAREHHCGFWDGLPTAT